MYHNRTMFLAICSHVLQLKAFGQLHIQLYCAALPGTSKRVGKVEVKLRAVERSVALVYHIGLAHLLNGGLQGLGGKLPILLVAHMVLGHSGYLDLVAEAKYGIDLIEELDHVFDLVLHLIPSHEYMGIVLSKTPHAEKAVKCAAQLMAVYKSQFAHTQRKISVRVGLRSVHKHSARAVHGLDGKISAVDHCGVHIVFIVIPVTAALPELTVEHHRRGYLNISIFLVHLTPIIYKCIAQHHALRQEERKSRALIHESKQSQFFAKFAMVTFLGLFNALEIRIQFVLLGKCYAVYTLERLPFCVSAPIRRIARQQLYCIAFDPSGGIQVRTCAQVSEFSLAVKAYNRIFRQIVDKLYLEGLVLHKFKSLGPWKLKALKLQLFFAYFTHFLFDLCHMVRRKCKWGIDIIVPSLVYRRSYRKLHFRPQALYGLRHDMRTCMPVSLSVFGILEGVFVLVHLSVPFCISSSAGSIHPTSDSPAGKIFYKLK